MTDHVDVSAYQQRITALQARVDELEQRLVTDDLMQILSRQGLMDYLEAVANEVRYQQQHPDKRRTVIVKFLSVLFIDIDHFKKVNDGYGHAAGDAVLKQVASLVRDQVRQLDAVGRYGGEEIVVGLVGAAGTHAVRIAEQIREKIAEQVFKIADQELHITVSVGVAELIESQSVAETLKAADTALYAAKNSGRNKVVVAEVPAT